MRPIKQQPSNLKTNQPSPEIKIEENKNQYQKINSSKDRNISHQTTGKKLNERTVSQEETIDIDNLVKNLDKENTEEEEFKAFKKAVPKTNFVNCAKKANDFAKNLNPTDYQPIVEFINGIQKNLANSEEQQELANSKLLKKAQNALLAFENFEINQKDFVENFVKLMVKVDRSNLNTDNQNLEETINKQLFHLHKFLTVAESINKKISEGKENLSLDELKNFAEKAENAIKELKVIFNDSEQFEQIELLETSLSDMKNALANLTESLTPDEKQQLNNVLSQVDSRLNKGTINAISRSLKPVLALVALVALYVFFLCLLVASSLAGPAVLLLLTFLVMATVIGASLYGGKFLQEILSALSEQSQQLGTDITEKLKSIKTIAGKIEDIPEGWKTSDIESLGIGKNQIKNKDLSNLFDFIQEKKKLAEDDEWNQLDIIEKNILQLNADLVQAKHHGIDITEFKKTLANIPKMFQLVYKQENAGTRINMLPDINDNLLLVHENILKKLTPETNLRLNLQNLLKSIEQKAKEYKDNNQRKEELITLYNHFAQILDNAEKHRIPLEKQANRLNNIQNLYNRYIEAIAEDEPEEKRIKNLLVAIERNIKSINESFEVVNQPNNPRNINLDDEKEDI